MNAPDTSHALAPDLVLLAPAAFAVRSTAQGLSAIEAGTGALLSILLKPSASGTPDDARLLESALALVQKKHAGARRVSVPVSIVSGRCRGHAALLNATTPSASIQLVLTTLIAPDPANAAQQRNLIVLLEIPMAAYAQRPAFYQRFAQDRLQIGTPKTVTPVPLLLQLAPLEAAAEAQPAVAIKPESPQPVTPPARAAAAARGQPRAAVAVPDADELLASAAHGQRTLAISIALSFVARAIGNVPDVPIVLAYAISAAVLIYAISGVLRICSGFGYSMNAKLVLMLCSSVPLLGIVCWVWLSVKTTRALRTAGYQVGLFGVRS